MGAFANKVKKDKILFYILSAAICLGIILTVVEYAARKSGLELRTFAQEIKGVYLWLVMPCIILFTGNALLSMKLGERASGEIKGKKSYKAIGCLRTVTVVIIFLVILVFSFFRGALYVLSSEMVEEKMMPEGYIQGAWANFLSETYYDYYIPVAGIFRKPFQGWTPEQLTEKVQEDYSPDAELFAKQENGWYVFRIPDKQSEGEFIYFHVSDSYKLESNGFFQILLNEAAHFWGNRDRAVALSADGNITFEDARDTDETTCPASTERFYITCNGSEEDIAACAADLADWLEIVKGLGWELYDIDSDTYSLLADMKIGSGNDYFYFSIYPLTDFIGDSSWENRYQKIKDRLEKAFEEHLAELQKNEERNQEQENSAAGDDTDSDIISEEELYTYFMDRYDGSYEKECLVEDTAIRYRMVIVDAAAGSRCYGLLKSTDDGETWQVSTLSPFGQQLGMGIDFTFLNENFGFATLMHNGGDEADLYVTEDGGNTYEAVVMEEYMVTLEDGFTYNPYDYPQMPYEEDGIIYVLCGQGADGDYAGGDAAGLALYRSTDGGHSFTFVKIQNRCG